MTGYSYSDFISLLKNPRIWIWGAILFTLLMCIGITGLHYQQQYDVNQAIDTLNIIGSARIDLVKGFLHYSLSKEFGTPYDASSGYALLDQAVKSFEQSIIKLHNKGYLSNAEGEALVNQFSEKVEAFKNLLHQQMELPGDDQNLQIRLRVALYDLEQQADLLDLKFRESLTSHTKHWEDLIILTLGFTFLFLAGLCAAVIYSMHHADEMSSVLAYTERRYRLLAENVGDIIWKMDLPSQKFTYISPSVSVLLGYDPKDAINQSLESMLTPQSLQVFKKEYPERMSAMERGIESVRVQTHEMDLVRKDNTFFPTETVTTLITDNNGRVTGMVGVTRDISERKKAENALYESEERYRRILDSMLEGFQILDHEFRYIYLNDVAVQQSGYSRNELLTSSLPVMYPGVEHTSMFQSLKKSMQERVPQNIESEFVFPDGKRSWYNLKIQPVPEGIAILSINITDQKLYQTELEIKNQELGATFEELAASEEELRQNYEELETQRNDLIKSEEKFRILADYTYNWEYWLSVDNRYVYVTPSVEHICGYRSDDFYQQKITIEQLIHPSDLQIYNNHVSLDEKKDKEEIIFRIITRHNQIKWIAHTCVPIFDSDGNFLGRRGTNRDITDKKLVEDELIRSYEELENRVQERTLELTEKNNELTYIQHVLEENLERLDVAEAIAHYGTWEMNMNTGHVFWSKEQYRIMGYEPDSVQPSYDMVMSRMHPEDRDRAHHEIQRIIDNQSSGTVYHRLLLPNGDVRFVHAQMKVLHDESENKVRLVGSSQDITEIVRAEDDRVKTANEIHDLYNNAPCGYHSLNSEGLIVRMNDTELSWLGYSSDEVVGKKHITDLLPSDSKKIFIANFHDFIKKGELSGIEIEMIRQDGTTFPVRVNASAIYDKTGSFVMSRSIVVDITEQKQFDEQLSRSLKEKETLLKEIHHRVKNNMQVISSLLFMQARALKDPEMIEIFNESQNRIKSLALIHEKLYQSDDLDRIDYGDYIKKIIDYLFQSYKATSHNITVKLDISEIYLHIDKAMPCSLIINEMISNSLKHAFPDGQKGEITIEMFFDSDMYHLNYSDNGIGLPDGFILERSSSLGMQLIKGLIGQLGGKMEIIRNCGTGYRMIFP